MNKNFRLLLSGQLVSQVGDKFHMIALAFWVIETTGSTTKMGLVLAASLIPAIVLGFFSGAVIDRYPRKPIIVGTDLIRGVALLIFAWMMYCGHIDFYCVLVLQVILSINAAFFDPAIPAVIPQIVGKDQLGRANAMHQGVYSFALIGGAVLGGLAVSTIGYLWIFVLDGLSFIISAGFESLMTIPPAARRESKGSLLSDIRAGYCYLLGNRSLLVIMFMVMAIHFFVGGIEVFMPVIADAVSETGPKALGMFQAALGIGILVMSLALGKIPISGTKTSPLFTSVMAMGGIQVLACFVPQQTWWTVEGYAVCFLLWGGAMIRAAVSFKTLLQIHTDNELGGRVFALASTIGNGSIPAAMIVFGLLLDYVPFSSLLPISGLALAGLGLGSLVMFKERCSDAEKRSPGIQEGAAGADRSEA